MGVPLVATSIHFDTRKLSSLIGVGYEAALTRSSWRQFANDVATAAGCEMAMVQYIDQDHPESSFMVCGGLGDEFEDAFAATSWQSEDDLFWASIRSKPAGTVQFGHEIVAPSAMRNTDAYSRVAMPWKLEHFLISSITASNGVSAFLSLGRSRGRDSFVAGDKALFHDLLLTHLRRSFAIHRKLAQSRSTSLVLSSVIDAAPYGVVVFNAQGRPLVINRKAGEIFSTSNGLTLINGRLHAADPRAHAQLEGALNMALHGAQGILVAPPDPVVIPRQGRPHPYHVLFSQLPLRPDETGTPGGSAVTALIHEEWLAGSRYLSVALGSVYRLTRAEIRLCQALLGGSSLAEAADQLNVSRNTAKTHLTRIFDKTRVRSQSALLRLLAVGSRDGINNP